jgi:hypothetical protein
MRGLDRQSDPRGIPVRLCAGLAPWPPRSSAKRTTNTPSAFAHCRSRRRHNAKAPPRKKGCVTVADAESSSASDGTRKPRPSGPGSSMSMETMPRESGAGTGSVGSSRLPESKRTVRRTAQRPRSTMSPFTASSRACRLRLAAGIHVERDCRNRVPHQRAIRRLANCQIDRNQAGRKTTVRRAGARASLAPFQRAALASLLAIKDPF